MSAAPSPTTRRREGAPSRVFRRRLEARASIVIGARRRSWPRSMSWRSSISTFPGPASGRASGNSPGSSRRCFRPIPAAISSTYLNALGETLAIAFLGTLTGALFALPLGILAARNVIPTAWLRLPIKRFFDVVRGIDTLIWALIWINVVGLGPFAGVLAIATSDFGALGKIVRGNHRIRRPARARGRARLGRPPARARCASACCRKCCR